MREDDEDQIDTGQYTRHKRLRDLAEKIGNVEAEKLGGDRYDIIDKSQRGYRRIARNLPSDEAFNFLRNLLAVSR